MGKFVMVLGASLLQRPAILSAKELGYNVCVVGMEMHPSVESVADEFQKIDLKDLDALAQFALSRRDSLAAVFTAGTDFSTSVAYIAEKCGLPSHSFEAAQNASNKVKMRECFRRCGVSSPSFTYVNLEKLAALKSEIKKGSQPLSLKTILSMDCSFPMVVKPADNMGSRGCQKVRTLDELISAAETAISFSRTSTAILEEFMDGPEFSLDGLIYNGKMIVTGFADRHIFSPPYFVEMGHTMPTDFPEEMQASVAREFQKAAEALGLSCGAAKGDIKFSGGVPKIGEVAGRLSGGYMSGWTFPYASSFNLTKAAMEIALGQEPTLFNEENLAKLIPVSPNLYIYPCEKYSAERAFISIPCVVDHIYGFPTEEESQSESRLQNFFPRINVGDKVSFPTNNVEKCGNVITLADNREEAISRAEAIIGKIILEPAFPNEDTEKFLAENSEFPPSAFAFSADNLVTVSDKLFVHTDEDIFSNLPDFVKSHQGRDFGGRTVSEALSLFRDFCRIHGIHGKIPLGEFCRGFCRGSVQGAVYLAKKYKVN